MSKFINNPSENEDSLVDELFYGLATRSFEWTKNQLMSIPTISNFDRINFYLFVKYAVSITDGIEIFEEQLKDELKTTCLDIKKI